MHKFLSLTYVTLKNAGGMVEINSNQKYLKIIVNLALLLCMLPTMIFLYMLFKEIFHAFSYMDQFASILAFDFQICSILIFISSILLIPSIFYFSKDNATLLSLPIPPQTILASKFVACYVYEYLFMLFCILPCLLAYLPYINFNLITFSSLFCLLLLLPIYPLALASLIVMITMRFVPFFKNRDRFNLISGIVSTFIAIAIVIFFNSQNGSIDTTTIISLLIDGNNSLLKMLSYLFPTLPKISLAIHEGSFFNLIIFLLLTLASITLCLFVAHKFYFKGLVGFSETSSSRKKLNLQQYQKKTIKQNRIQSYIKKELLLLLRTPAYVLNCLSSIVMTPIILLIITITNQQNMQAIQLPAQAYKFLPYFAPYIVLIGLALGFFIGNLSFVSSTAISREGTNITFMKSIPMPLKDQLFAKVCSGIIISLIGNILTFICFQIAIPILPIPYLFLCFIASVLSMILANYIGLYIDLLKPKLIWEQEAIAVKQNIAGVISAFIGMFALFAFGFIIVITPMDYALLIASICCIIILVVILIMHKLLHRYGIYCFNKYGG